MSRRFALIACGLGRGRLWPSISMGAGASARSAPSGSTGP